MKKTKSKKIVWIVVVVLLLSSFSYIAYSQYMKKQNVFAEMIYVNKNDTQLGNEFEYFQPNANMATMHGNKYGKEYLNEDEDILLSWEQNIIVSDTLNIWFRKTLENDTETHAYTYIEIPFHYNALTKILTYEPIEVYFGNSEKISSISKQKEDVLYVMQKYGVTREDIETYRKYTLYDVLLPHWFETNRNNSYFSMDNLGDFKVVDNTFQNIDK